MAVRILTALASLTLVGAIDFHDKSGAWFGIASGMCAGLTVVFIIAAARVDTRELQGGRR